MTAPEGMQFNDTETIVYGASLIASLGDLSPLYPGTVDVSKMVRLKELIVGSTINSYRNNNLHSLYIGENRLLRLLNMSNCPNYTQPIDVSGCDNLEELYAQGSSATAVLLPSAGILHTMHLPATIASLTLLNQINLTDDGLVLDGIENISTVRIEGTNNVNAFAVIDQCLALGTPKLERVRLIDVSGQGDSLDTLVRLSKLKGLDENGDNIEKAVITGKYHAATVTQSKLAAMQAAFPELEITYVQSKPDSVTTFVFSSSQNKTITNSSLDCNLDYMKVNETTYRITAQDNEVITFTFKCENHADYANTYLVAGTRTQNYIVTYIPLRTMRVKVYNQSIYPKGAVLKIGDKKYISDENGYVYYRGGEAISGNVTALGYVGGYFSFPSITNDTTNTIEVYGAVEIKFIVKFGSILIQGATVSCGGQQAITNLYGECILSLSKGNYAYIVTHPNYFDKTADISVGTSALTINVTMEPKEIVAKFIVKDDSGVFASGVTVTCDGKSGVTNDSGECYLSVASKTTHVYQTKKTNYYNTTGTFTTYTSDVTVNVVIEIDIAKYKPVENGNIQMLVMKYGDVYLQVTSTKTDYIIDWGDGSSSNALRTGMVEYVHQYEESGNYQVEIRNCSEVTKCECKNSRYSSNDWTVAYWSIGDSKVSNLTFSYNQKLRYFGDVFKNDAGRTDLSKLFNSCYMLTHIDLSPLARMTNATNLNQIFYSCRFSTIDLSPLSVMVKATDLSYMFYNCKNLISVDLSPLSGMTNVTNLNGLFSQCEHITSIDLSPLAGMTKVTNLSRLLYQAGLKSVDLSPLSGMTNVTDLSLLVSNNPNITSVDLSPLADMTKNKNLYGLLSYNSRLSSIDLSPLAGMKDVTDLGSLLMETGVESVDLLPLAGMTKNTSLRNFLSNTNITSIDLSPLAGMTNVTDLYRFMYYCTRLTTIKGMPYFEKATNYEFFMRDCRALTSPLPELWKLCYGKTVTKTDCFLNCTSAPNYSDVPKSWGGIAPEYVPPVVASGVSLADYRAINARLSNIEEKLNLN